MSVKIGEARFDENGKTSYGEPGDQTGEEVKISDFYINEQKPWSLVFRPKNKEVARKIALAMTQACNNDNIGYAQVGDGSTVYRDRYGLYYALKAASSHTIPDVTIPCNCDCSSLVAQCVRAAGIDVSIYMSTSNEPTILMNTGEFDKITFERGMTLLTGDIMWRQRHTAVITSGDDNPSWDKTPKWVGSANAYCNVYNSNSTSSGLLKSWPHLSTGNLVDVCDWDDKFYYVRIAAKYFGFVERKYIGEPPAPTPYEEFDGKAKTAVNLRQGPGTNYGYCNIDRNDGKGVRHQLYAGEVVTVVNEDNGWYSVEIKGATATWYPWCSAQYIVKVEPIVPKVGDTVKLFENVLYASDSGLQGKIKEIKGDKYLIELSDGCEGYSYNDKFELL